MRELKEFTELVDRGERWIEKSGQPKPPTPEEITRTIQVLMAHQVVYPHQNQLKRVYEVLTHFRPFFEAWFAAMGAELFFDHRSRFFVLRPIKQQTRHDALSARLPKDTSMVLVALKVAYEDGIKRNDQGERAEINISSDDLVEKLDVIAGSHPEEGRLNEILRFLKRKGIVEVGEVDRIERVRPIAILPAIDLLVPEEYLAQVIQSCTSDGTVEVDATAAEADLASDEDEEESADA